MSSVSAISPSRDRALAVGHPSMAEVTACTVDANDANKDTQTRVVDLSASYAPEILEFWVYKHHADKAEADALKVRDVSAFLYWPNHQFHPRRCTLTIFARNFCLIGKTSTDPARD